MHRLGTPQGTLAIMIVGSVSLSSGGNTDTILGHGVSAETDTFYVRQRCRHVVIENHRVIQSIAALQAGDLEEFGRLLKEAHASARDDYEISTPEIEALVQLANGVPGTAGTRLTARDGVAASLLSCPKTTWSSSVKR